MDIVSDATREGSLMRRPLIALLIAVLAVLPNAWPASASPDLLPDLGLTSSAGSSVDEAPQQASGRTWARDRVLRQGCRRYSFRYDIQVPSSDWSMEISIVDRRGKAVSAHAFFGPAHDKTARARFGLCRAATVPGKFRIRTTLHWYDDPSEPIKVDVPVSRFRLSRR